MQQTLRHHRKQIEVLRRPVHHTDLDDPSVHRCSVVVSRDIITCNDIDDDVNTGAIREPLGFCNKIFFQVIDREIRT